MKFKKYRRLGVAEMREVTTEDTIEALAKEHVSISEADLMNGSPKPGDMIARNPENPEDQWLVANDYFVANFEVTGQ